MIARLACSYSSSPAPVAQTPAEKKADPRLPRLPRKPKAAASGRRRRQGADPAGHLGGLAGDQILRRQAGPRRGVQDVRPSCLDPKSGGFADAPGGKPDVILTAVGLMALVELDIPTEPYEKAAIAYMTTNAKQFEEVRMAAAGLEAVGKRSDKNDAWIEDVDEAAEPRRHVRQGQGAAPRHRRRGRRACSASAAR